MSRKIVWGTSIVFAVLLVTCGLAVFTVTHALSRSATTTFIDAPASNSAYHVGETLDVQSTSTDPNGIGQVELTVDGAVVHVDAPPQKQTTFAVVQTWTVTAGEHTIGVRALNASGQPGNLAQIVIRTVSEEPATPTAIESPTPTLSTTRTPALAPTLTPVPSTIAPEPTRMFAPAAACNNSAFVADVTVPDGSVLAAAQSFTKVWRLLNTGTCAWTNSYTLTFVAGDPMAAPLAIEVPYTAPGATADLIVPMTAEPYAGFYTGYWQLRAPSGLNFGTTVHATIDVVTYSSAPTVTLRCSGVPVIEYLNVSPSTITAGDSATLSWGLVSNADAAYIDNGIGGQATPGNITVSPGSTTTYTLTAYCGSNTQTAQVTLTVLAPTDTPTPAATATATPVTPTSTPIATATAVPVTPTSTPTAQPTATSAPTSIATATATPVTPTSTPIATATAVPVTPTSTPTAQPTATGAPSRTPAPTLTPAPTRTPEPTRTFAPTRTPEPTRTFAPTRTPEPTRTPAPTRTPEPTRTPAPTRTPEPTRIPPATRAPAPTQEPRPTAVPTPTATPRARGQRPDTTSSSVIETPAIDLQAWWELVK